MSIYQKYLMSDDDMLPSGNEIKIARARRRYRDMLRRNKKRFLSSVKVQ